MKAVELGQEFICPNVDSMEKENVSRKYYRVLIGLLQHLL